MTGGGVSIPTPPAGMNTPPTPPGGAPHQPLWRTPDEIAALFDVQPRTVKMWAYRGHITVGPDGHYDENEVRDWYTNRRNKRMDQIRQGERGTTVTTAAAESIGIKPRTLRKWVERGHVRCYGTDCYDAGDIADRWNRLARTGHFDTTDD